MKLSPDGSLWITAPNSVEQVGCIPTCQEMELDYVSVIIGPALRWIDGTPTAFRESRSRMGRSIRDYKTLAKQNPDATRERVERIVRNTYKTLISRGMKGCYAYIAADADVRVIKTRKPLIANSKSSLSWKNWKRT